MAVGHASDRSVADLVAHTSVPTPTAAAAWLVDRHRSHDDETASRVAAEAMSRERAESELARREAEDIAQRGRRLVAQGRALVGVAVVAVLVVVLVVLVSGR
jgi:exonuclease VII large subunit